MTKQIIFIGSTGLPIEDLQRITIILRDILSLEFK